MVGATRFELVTSSVSGKRSPPELSALAQRCGLCPARSLLWSIDTIALMPLFCSQNFWPFCRPPSTPSTDILSHTPSHPHAAHVPNRSASVRHLSTPAHQRYPAVSDRPLGLTSTMPCERSDARNPVRRCALHKRGVSARSNTPFFHLPSERPGTPSSTSLILTCAGSSTKSMASTSAV